ncbi:hypothetical protein Mapa_013313 [Marchantia paleacea]|nr:hypothetical protein Mapa_013313 [Marchantia paleacea]
MCAKFDVRMKHGHMIYSQMLATVGNRRVLWKESVRNSLTMMVSCDATALAVASSPAKYHNLVLVRVRTRPLPRPSNADSHSLHRNSRL